MNEKNHLLLLYGHFPSSQNKNGSYRVITITDERGTVDRSSLKFALNGSVGRSLDYNEEIRFYNLDELNKFAYSLMDGLEAPSVCISSIDVYNTCLEKTTSPEELKSLLFESSNCIENADYSSSEKGLLSKFFS